MDLVEAAAADRIVAGILHKIIPGKFQVIVICVIAKHRSEIIKRLSIKLDPFFSLVVFLFEIHPCRCRITVKISAAVVKLRASSFAGYKRECLRFNIFQNCLGIIFKSAVYNIHSREHFFNVLQNLDSICIRAAGIVSFHPDYVRCCEVVSLPVYNFLY